MSFSLEHFNLHFNEDILISGEQLFENESIQSFEEIERNLWLFEMKDQKHYEIEILISPSKVLKYSCDCNEFKKTKKCRHVIACLFKLRLFKTKSIRSGATVVRSTPKKLNIANILNQIDESDLKNFIKLYAKKDKRFATALKANFARSIEIENNEEKYERILQGIVRPATNKTYRITINTIRQLLNVSEQFQAQFEDALSLKQYKEAYFIIKAIIGKISYVHHWVGNDNVALLKTYKALHKQYEYFLHLEIPPSLFINIFEFGLELIHRSYYHILDERNNLFLILWNNSKQDSHKFAIFNALKEKFSSTKLHHREIEHLWVLKQLFFEEGFTDLEIKTTRLSSQSVYRISDHLMEMQKYFGLENFISLFKVKGLLRDKYLAKNQLKIFQILNKKDELIDEGIKYLMLFKDIDFYRILIQNESLKKEEIFELVRTKLDRHITKENENLMLSILRFHNQIPEIEERIKFSRFSFDHFYTFAEYLRDNDSDLSQIIETILNIYLKEYFGPESTEKIRTLLLFLKYEEYHETLKKIKVFLEKDYSERQNIINVSNSI